MNRQIKEEQEEFKQVTGEKNELSRQHTEDLEAHKSAISKLRFAKDIRGQQLQLEKDQNAKLKDSVQQWQDLLKSKNQELAKALGKSKEQQKEIDYMNAFIDADEEGRLHHLYRKFDAELFRPNKLVDEQKERI